MNRKTNTTTANRGLKKTNSYANYNISKSSPTDPLIPYLPQQDSPYDNHKKLQFPTSPQLIFGHAIIHFSHPQHPLYQIDLPDLFTCSGCREFGAGKRFSCQQCDFQLHEYCALPPKSLKSHPLHLHHNLMFYSKPVKGVIVKSKCDICGKPTKGYSFRCDFCSYQMHPSCSMLSNEIRVPIHQHPLKIMPSNSQNIGDMGILCGECKRRRSGRVYQCSVCDYYLHAVCAKNMVNGLQDNGIKCPEKACKFGKVARLASQVVVDFVGGLVEGLGEEVGQAFITSSN